MLGVMTVQVTFVIDYILLEAIPAVESVYIRFCADQLVYTGESIHTHTGHSWYSAIVH